MYRFGYILPLVVVIYLVLCGFTFTTRGVNIHLNGLIGGR